MSNSIIEKNKGVLILIIMVIAFSFIASRRVENLEKFNYSNNRNFVYNKWKKNKWYFEIIDVKKEEENAVISYNELLNKKSK